ncbi:MAG: hypothetical protein K2L70_08595 [Clostridia bacterium]|nr:hypothetical protein [Clostridia bacterium]
MSKYSQVKDEVFSIEYLPSGAPQLISCGKPNGYVSVSHSDGVLAIAFSECKIGIDIERADRKVSPKICKSIEHWTAIEAYAKWTREGLSKDIISQRLPEDMISTMLFGEYVISICSQCKDIEMTQLD